MKTGAGFELYEVLFRANNDQNVDTVVKLNLIYGREERENEHFTLNTITLSHLAV